MKPGGTLNKLDVELFRGDLLAIAPECQALWHSDSGKMWSALSARQIHEKLGAALMVFADSEAISLEWVIQEAQLVQYLGSPKN